MSLSTNKARRRGRSEETGERYLSQGHRHLSRAQRLNPMIADPIEALVASIERDEGILKSNTVGVYRQELDAIISHLARELPEPARAQCEAMRRINDALERRRGRPDEPRTSSKKVKDGTPQEVDEIFRYIAKRAVIERDAGTIVMALAIYYFPRVGCRPVEWMGATVEGRTVRIENAKRRVDDPPTWREITLRDVPNQAIEVAPQFIKRLEEAVARYTSFEAWRRAASELLARVCARVGVRRLCLYAFRDVAIATWKAAGLSPWEIAVLAGHWSTKTATRHYASEKHGHPLEVARANQAAIIALQQKAQQNRPGDTDATEVPPRHDRGPDEDALIEDLPRPVLPPSPERETISFAPYIEDIDRKVDQGMGSRGGIRRRPDGGGQKPGHHPAVTGVPASPKLYR